VEKFRKAVQAGDLVKENGPKIPAISYFAAVTFKQILIMSSGAYSSFLSPQPALADCVFMSDSI
jgi:hypothetical protein